MEHFEARCFGSKTKVGDFWVRMLSHIFVPQSKFSLQTKLSLLYFGWIGRAMFEREISIKYLSSVGSQKTDNAISSPEKHGFELLAF